MIAENKEEFFEQLQRELKKLGVEDTGELLGDLEEHFAEGERRGVPEAETCRELGSIAEIARSCLDIKSTAINSMVARDVERKKGVSLTKPGRSVPADPSLAAGNTVPGEGADLPSYTPEHISEEIYPNTASQSGSANIGSQDANAAGAVGAAVDNESAGTGGHSGANVNNESADTGGSTNKTADGGTFEKVGKAVDAAFDKAGKALGDALGKAGDALNKAGTSFRPSDSYRENINNNRNGGKIPPQFTKVKGHGGSEFVDTSNLKPNVNGGRLALEIILDVFLWSWLIPVIFSLVIAAFGVAVGLIVWGIECIIGHSDFGQFVFITRILFMLGFFNLSAAVFCLAPLLLKAGIGFVKNIIARHLKAIYDI